MPNEDNLVSFADRTVEEQREIATKGGVASGVARKKLKTAAEILRYYMNLKNIDHPDLTNLEVMELHLANAAVRNNIKGNPNLKAIDMVHAMLGEKKDEQQRTAEQIIKYVSEAEYKEVNAHIDSVIGDTDDTPTGNIE
jgi:hypothetical protein